MSADDGTRRLCIVTPAHSGSITGGAEYQIDCLIGVLNSLHRTEIFYLSSTHSGDDGERPYHVVRVGHPRRAPRFGYITQAVPLYRALQQIRPHAIYQRVACGYTAVCASYARRNGIRMVWHVAHDSDVTPGASLDGRNPLRRFLEKESVEYGIRRAGCIVTQTRDQAHLLEEHYGRQPDAVIPNFHPYPAERIDKSGPLTVAWVASLKPWKAPEAFLDLADAFRDRPEVRFVMIGPEGTGAGQRAWFQDLQRRVQATWNVDYRGPRSQAEVNELLAQSHLFVNTSLHEGFANTFIQAWMREVPVISLHVNPDGLLDDRGVGIFCEHSPSRMVEAVRTLLGDASMRSLCAVTAREYAMSRHSLANASELARLIDSDGSVRVRGAARASGLHEHISDTHISDTHVSDTHGTRA